MSLGANPDGSTNCSVHLVARMQGFRPCDMGAIPIRSFLSLRFNITFKYMMNHIIHGVNMPYKNPNKQREFQKEWQRKHRAEARKYQRSLRTKVLELLGGKCVYCGCNDFEALEINHINGQGAKEKQKRWKHGNKGYYCAILNGTRSIEDLELTCRVCNARHYLNDIKGIGGTWIIQWVGVIEGVANS